VVFPLYAIYVSFCDIRNAFAIRNGVVAARMEMDRLEKEKEKVKELEKEGKKESKKDSKKEGKKA
jgi:hypothetical protein